MKMYVVTVRKGCENSVFRQLEKRGFDAVLPLKNGKIIFSDYVFLRCDFSEKIYYEVGKIEGVTGFLTHSLRAHEQRRIELFGDGV